MQYPVRGGGRRSFRALAVALVLTALGGCQPQTFERADGSALSWDALRGQWVLVNYWARWCKPCLQEIPELNALDAASDITVLGVNYDGVNGVELVQQGQELGIEFALLAEDPGPALGWSAPVGLPATFVVTPDGSLLQARFGPQTEAGIRALMHSYQP